MVRQTPSTEMLSPILALLRSNCVEIVKPIPSPLRSMDCIFPISWIRPVNNSFLAWGNLNGKPSAGQRLGCCFSTGLQFGNIITQSFALGKMIVPRRSPGNQRHCDALKEIPLRHPPASCPGGRGDAPKKHRMGNNRTRRTGRFSATCGRASDSRPIHADPCSLYIKEDELSIGGWPDPSRKVGPSPLVDNSTKLKFARRKYSVDNLNNLS